MKSTMPYHNPHDKNEREANNGGHYITFCCIVIGIYLLWKYL